MSATQIQQNPQLVLLSDDDVIDEYDEWSPEGSGLWYQAWDEDVGRTVARAKAITTVQGEPGAYLWRGLR